MIKTISDLLISMDLEYRVFDLGRHIQEIDNKTFSLVEQQLRPYPCPYLQHAWLGLLLWHKKSRDIPMLWFVKLPLDEQGKLSVTDRDLFLKQLIIALGSSIDAQETGRQLASVLEGNPYIFTPPPQRQASLHARINQLLGNPPSHYYAATAEYLRGDTQQWQQLAIQGIADLCERWGEHSAELAGAIATMPEQALIPFSQCLEDQTIGEMLGQALSDRLQGELKQPQPNPNLLSALVRGLSQCRSLQIRQDALLMLLHSSSAEILEVLVSIATRCTTELCNPAINQAFLEILSQQGQETFNRVLADVMFSPAIRQHILLAFQQPGQSPALSQAIAGLMRPA